MKMRTGLIRALAALSTGALLLAACGSPEDGVSSPEGTDTSPETSAPRDAPSDAAETGTDESGSGAGLVVEGEEIADSELWASAQEEGGLVLYTSVTEQRMRADLEAFSEQVGLDVELVRLPGGRLAERILSEHASDVLPADVIMQSDYSLALQLMDEGVFEPHCVAGWDQLPQDRVEPDCYFWPSMDSAHIIIYNTELVSADEAPKAWDDLLDSRWAGGNFIFPYIGTGGSTWARDLYLRNEKGVEFWEQLASQDPVLTASSGTTTESVVRGEVPVGNVVVGAALEAVSQGSPIALVFPQDGSPAYSTWTGLSSSAASPAAGKVFLNWLASRAGQTAVSQRGGDYSVLDDIAPPSADGQSLPSKSEARFAYVELLPEYVTERENYQEEWLEIFNYTG